MFYQSKDGQNIGTFSNSLVSSILTFAVLLCRRITLIVGNASDVTAVLFPSSHFVDGVEQAADVIAARRADQSLLAVDVVV